MKKLLLLLAFCGLGLVACGNDDEPKKNQNQQEQQKPEDEQKPGDEPSSSYDIDAKTKRFEGLYYGTQFSAAHNYNVFLSNKGLSVDGYTKPGDVYFAFDLYSDAGGNGDAPVLPNGTYTFDANDTMAAQTFGNEWSYYMDTDGKQHKFVSGTVTVTDNKFEAEAVIAGNKTLHVVFEGDLTVDYDYVSSTFLENLEFAIEGAEVTVTNHGNENDHNKYNWVIEAVKGNEYFILDLYNSSADSAAGLYTNLAESDYDYNNKFVPGVFMENSLVGSWYATLKNGKINTGSMAPFTNGLIQVKHEGNAVTIEFGCQDDAENEVSGSVVGVIAE